MKAVVHSGFGGPEVLGIRDVPDPAFGPDEIRVRVRATALNRADLLQRRGLYPAPPGAPADIPGLEFAGEVEGTGSRVAAFRPGDRVMGIVGGGGHAEKVVLHERMALRIPPAVPFEEAGAIPEAFLTAWDALSERGVLRPGESLFVTAAASGVGTATLAIAKAMGARVFAASRSAEKRRRLTALGADRVFDPADEALLSQVRSAAGGDGVDCIVDFVGAASWRANLDMLTTRGRLVLVGTLSGSRVETDLSTILRRRITVVGTVLRARPLEEKITLTQVFSRTILPMIATGRLRPVVDRVVPLSEIVAAHQAMERNESFGKIVLAV